MNSLGIILPDQLSKNNLVYEKLNSDDDLLLYEPIESFYKLNHNKQKLVFLLASLRNLIEPLGLSLIHISEPTRPY